MNAGNNRTEWIRNSRNAESDPGSGIFLTLDPGRKKFGFKESILQFSFSQYGKAPFDRYSK
jgi:hypothetical protein